MARVRRLAVGGGSVLGVLAAAAAALHTAREGRPQHSRSAHACVRHVHHVPLPGPAIRRRPALGTLPHCGTPCLPRAADLGCHSLCVLRLLLLGRLRSPLHNHEGIRARSSASRMSTAALADGLVEPPPALQTSVEYSAHGLCWPKNGSPRPVRQPNCCCLSLTAARGVWWAGLSWSAYTSVGFLCVLQYTRQEREWAGAGPLQTPPAS